MLYTTAAEWEAAPQKRIMLFGMSGLGKTHISNILRAEGNWFHYSVDYRIGTRYMGEHIADNFKREAMKVPLLRELLISIRTRARDLCIERFDHTLGLLELLLQLRNLLRKLRGLRLALLRLRIRAALEDLQLGLGVFEF